MVQYMNLRTLGASALALSFALSFGVANAQTALSVSCSGAPTATSVAWTASASGGIAPYAYLWGNGSTSTSQTVTYAPGTYSMTIQATDASSSVATSTCAATVVAAPTAPAISAFTATPASITAGQSSVLAWTVANASSTSIDNSVGDTSSVTSTTVTPSVTTTYTLTAVNPAGTSTAAATVTVTPVSTSTPSTLQQQIQALLQQIAALQQQIRNLIAGQIGTGTSTPPVIPPGQVGKQACISLGRDVSEGDSGDDVRGIQQMLASNPAYGFNASPTGYFGPMTKRAMMRYQEMNGIVASSSGTGYVGSLTRGFFERECGQGLMKQGESESSSTSDNSTTTSDSGSVSSSTTGTQALTHAIIPNFEYGNSGEHGNGHGDN